MDMKLLYLIQATHTRLSNEVMLFLTSLGNGFTIWMSIAVIMLLFRRTRRCGVLMMFSMLTAKLIGEDLLKPLIHRMRPCRTDYTVLLLIRRPGDYSCPSGHAAHSFASAGVIWLESKRLGRPALILAALIGYSRLYLFVHYPTDVLAGALLGLLTAGAIVYAARAGQCLLESRPLRSLRA